ncbi:hypothetical protein N0B31_11660 [Salinirubellus salinus]|uniref:Uncharacterized protein n=1 Tax=Salinirubellus salinus TaxID=1364945 RepID=A0A9E7QZI3_9EURY|nr:hypothetical protein [Salinirubellus salinus]UWM52807.1 hypothetical protein N0B31_11660 [Salinirubellus salinus]
MTARLTRRTVLGGLAATGLAATGLATLPAPSAGTQVMFAVEDASITTDDGTIDGVAIDVDGSWQFDGVDTPGTDVHLQLGLKGETEPETWTWETVAVDGQSITPAHAATGTFAFEDVDLLAETVWTAEDFAAPANDSVNSGEEGQTETETTLTLRLLLQVRDAGGALLVQDEKRASFDITVVNEPSSVGSEGGGTVELSGSNEEHTE